MLDLKETTLPRFILKSLIYTGHGSFDSKIDQVQNEAYHCNNRGVLNSFNLLCRTSCAAI